MENISFKSARTVPVEFLCKVPSALDRVIQDATTDLALRVLWELEKGECVCSLSAPEQIQSVDLNQVEIRRQVNFQRLVRCGECKHWKVYKNDCGWGLCEKHDIDHPCHDDWFCADGEREVQE